MTRRATIAARARITLDSLYSTDVVIEWDCNRWGP